MICPYCNATVLSTSQPDSAIAEIYVDTSYGIMVKLAAGGHRRATDDEKAKMLAALAVTPAVDDCSCGGGDISGHDTLCPYAQPDSPLRGRETLPTYGSLPWDQLGLDVNEAMTGERFAFQHSGYPGHSLCPINFNSLARIVDKYRLAAPSNKDPSK